MAWTPLFLLTLLHCTGSLSQPVLTQSPSASVTLKSSVKVTCTLSSGYDSYTVDWYQQNSGKGLRFLMRVGAGGLVGSKGEGIPDRFSGSGSGLDRFLTIQNIQEEDEADYFCGAPHGSWSDYVYVFGSGTKVTVIGQPKSAPTVTLFPPSSEEISTNQVTLVCMINGFYPSDVVVTWTGDGIPLTQGVDTTKPMKQSDNKYAASSYLSLTRREWESRNQFVCKVTHEGTTIEKTVSPA